MQSFARSHILAEFSSVTRGSLSLSIPYESSISSQSVPFLRSRNAPTKEHAFLAKQPPFKERRNRATISSSFFPASHSEIQSTPSLLFNILPTYLCIKKRLKIGGGVRSRQKPQAPTPQAPVRNRQTRKVANAKVRIG